MRSLVGRTPDEMMELVAEKMADINHRVRVTSEHGQGDIVPIPISTRKTTIEERCADIYRRHWWAYYQWGWDSENERLILNPIRRMAYEEAGWRATG